METYAFTCNLVQPSPASCSWWDCICHWIWLSLIFMKYFTFLLGSCLLNGSFLTWEFSKQLSLIILLLGWRPCSQSVCILPFSVKIVKRLHFHLCPHLPALQLHKEGSHPKITKCLESPSEMGRERVMIITSAPCEVFTLNYTQFQVPWHTLAHRVIDSKQHSFLSVFPSSFALTLWLMTLPSWGVQPKVWPVGF